MTTAAQARRALLSSCNDALMRERREAGLLRAFFGAFAAGKYDPSFREILAAHKRRIAGTGSPTECDEVTKRVSE